MAIKFCYFKPSSNLNQDLVERYHANILQCTRQFAYSTDNHNTIDMVLSVNGIPVVALELKNQLTGQSVANGKHQFMYDRDPKELLFYFNTRILAYFAVDLYEVAMTTQLQTTILGFEHSGSSQVRLITSMNRSDKKKPSPGVPNSYSTSIIHTLCIRSLITNH